MTLHGVDEGNLLQSIQFFRLKKIDRYKRQHHIPRPKVETAVNWFLGKSGKKENVPEVRLDLYYNEDAKDFRLMMNLLSEQSAASLAHSFRILGLFDKHFQRQWKPVDLNLQKSQLLV